MSCVYCAPKSRMRIFSWDIVRERRKKRGERTKVKRGFLSSLLLLSLFNSIIRRFLRDLHVVHVRLAYARRRDLDELGFRPHLFDRAAAEIAHARAHAAHELLDERHETAF